MGLLGIDEIWMATGPCPINRDARERDSTDGGRTRCVYAQFARLHRSGQHRYVRSWMLDDDDANDTRRYRRTGLGGYDIRNHRLLWWLGIHHFHVGYRENGQHAEVVPDAIHPGRHSADSQLSAIHVRGAKIKPLDLDAVRSDP
jgi:hypothetical protein